MIVDKEYAWWVANVPSYVTVELVNSGDDVLKACKKHRRKISHRRK